MMKKLILRCDDFGSSSGANEAIMELARAGFAMNVSVMVCAPEARLGLEELATFGPRVCLGIHATITSEWSGVKWGPVRESTRGTNLVDADGYFHPSLHQACQVAPSVIKDEVEAQIEEALSWDIPFSYLDEHMGFNWLHDLQSHHAELAARFSLAYYPDLPNLPRTEAESSDILLGWNRRLAAASPGEYLLVTHPALDNDSTQRFWNETHPPRAISRARSREFAALSSAAWPEKLREGNTTLITYRELL